SCGAQGPRFVRGVSRAGRRVVEDFAEIGAGGAGRVASDRFRPSLEAPDVAVRGFFCRQTTEISRSLPGINHVRRKFINEGASVVRGGERPFGSQRRSQSRVSSSKRDAWDRCRRAGAQGRFTNSSDRNPTPRGEG